VRSAGARNVAVPSPSSFSTLVSNVFRESARARARRRSGTDTHRSLVAFEKSVRRASSLKTRTRSPGDFSAKSASVPGGLPEHIKALKAAVDKQRAEVPALVMKQTSAHLEALQSFDGALEEIENMKRDTENLIKSHGGGVGGGAVDVQRDLLEKCEQLPELQRRLQTATAKLGTILSQMDASAAAVEA
jgi:hypothetical protein